MNYTKGEWIKQGAFIFSSESPPRLIAEVIRSNMAFLEQQANAHLIAAASNMYEALKSLSLGDIDPIYRQIIIKVLAKAEGKANQS